MPIIIAGSIALRMPWLGMVAFVVLMLLTRYWWSCLLGLLNLIAILAGLVSCAISTWKRWGQ
jgi:hypothetical protein